MAKTQQITAEDRYERNVDFLMYFWLHPVRQEYISLREKYLKLLEKRHEQTGGGKVLPLGPEYRVVECDFLAADTADEAEEMLRRLRGTRLETIAGKFRDGYMAEMIQKLRDSSVDLSYKVKSHGHHRCEFGVDPSTRSGKGRWKGGNSGPSE